MSTWFRRMLRTVLPSAAGPRPPLAESRRTIRWSMEAPVDESPPPWRADDPQDAPGETRPMVGEAHGWLTSSMDLMTGMEVVEDAEPDPDRAQPIAGRSGSASSHHEFRA